MLYFQVWWDNNMDVLNQNEVGFLNMVTYHDGIWFHRQYALTNYVCFMATNKCLGELCMTHYLDKVFREALVPILNIVGYFISSTLFSFEAQQQTQPDKPLAINPPQVKLSLGCLSGRPKMVSSNVKHTSSCITPSYITPIIWFIPHIHMKVKINS